MATATSNSFPLASEQPYSGGADSSPGDVGSSGDSQAADNAAGASGSSPGSYQISHGAMIAIIVIVVVVGVIGIASMVLFFVAKKREWKVRETLRRSARKVVAALTPRRSEFPKSVKDSSPARSRGGRGKSDDVPPTPRLKPEDLEKGLGKGDKKNERSSRRDKPRQK